MPELPVFEVVASTQAARTVFLSGDVSALLFSALAALGDLHQWSRPGGLTVEDLEFIYTLLDKGNDQLMTPLIGQIIMYATADAPTGSLPCDGGTYARVDYQALYDVLDSAYILDADNFVTPALSGRSPIGIGTNSDGVTLNTNEQIGESFHELTEEELASHSHSDLGHVHSYQPPGSAGLAVAPGELPVALPNIIPSVTGSSSALIQATGLSVPHNTIHPVTGIKFAIIFQ